MRVNARDGRAKRAAHVRWVFFSLWEFKKPVSNTIFSHFFKFDELHRIFLLLISVFIFV